MFGVPEQNLMLAECTLASPMITVPALKPKLKRDSSHKLWPARSFLSIEDRFRTAAKRGSVDPPDLGQHWVLKQLLNPRTRRLECDKRASTYKRFSSPFKDLNGQQLLECPAHKKASAARLCNLFARNTDKELYEIAVEVGISVFIAHTRRRPAIRQGFLHGEPRTRITERGRPPL